MALIHYFIVGVHSNPVI